MKKKKYISTGIFAVAVVIGAGVAYYFNPAAINNILGINSSQVDAVSSTDLLAMDDASSSTPFASVSSTDASNGEMGDGDPAPVVSSTSRSDAVGENTSATQGDSSQTPAAISSSSQSDAVAVAAETTSSPIAATASACSFPSSAPSTTRQVIFNEIAWMGSSSSSAAEWIELKNISSYVADLSGWELLNASGKIKILFTDGDTISPGGLILLSRGSASSTASIASAKTYSGDLVNTGDALALIDARCDVSDYLDASRGWPGGNNTTKQTLERDANGIGWHTSASPGGTPGAENSAGPMPTAALAQASDSGQASIQASASDSGTSATSSDDIATTGDDGESASSSPANATSSATGNDDNIVTTSTIVTTITTTTTAAAGHILIAAVQIGGASSSNDLVELYNPTAAAVDMSGWKLHKKSETGTDYSLKEFPSGSTIAAGQFFVWANSDGGFSDAMDANVASTETLAADNSVALMDAAGNIVDAVAWGTGTSQYGEGPPYPTSPGANQLLSRRSSGGVMADTDNNTNDFIIQ